MAADGASVGGSHGHPAAGPVCLVNTTPHPVVLLGSDDRPRMTLPAAERPARREVYDEPGWGLETEAGTVDVVPQRLGPVIDLPGPAPGVVYVAARVVAEAAGRDDVVVPDDVVRDADGGVIGCRRLTAVVLSSSAVTG